MLDFWKTFRYIAHSDLITSVTPRCLRRDGRGQTAGGGKLDEILANRDAPPVGCRRVRHRIGPRSEAVITHSTRSLSVHPSCARRQDVSMRNADIKAALDELRVSWQGWKTRHDDRYLELQDRIEELESRAGRFVTA